MQMQEFQRHAILQVEQLRRPPGASNDRLREIAGPPFPLMQAGAGHLGSLHSSVRAYHVTWQELRSDTIDQQDVIAVKMIKLSDKKARMQAQSEINNIASLSHIHIVAFVDSFVYSGVCHIAMYPAAQFDLVKYLHDASKLAQSRGEANLRDHARMLRDIRRFFSCLCSALRYIHNSIADIRIKHGDIKPGNILVDRYRNILLTDFGISKQYPRHESPSTFSVKGTPMYAAPEVLGHNMSPERRGLRIDIFSLGCVFLEMASVLIGYHIDKVHKHFTRSYSSDNGMDVINRIRYGSPYGLQRLREWRAEMDSKTPTNISRNQLDCIESMMSEVPGSRPNLTVVWDLFQDFRDADVPCPCVVSPDSNFIGI